MDSINSLNAQQATEAAWNLYEWMQQQDVLGKEAKAIGNAGNPNFDPNNNSNPSSTPNSF